MIIDCDTCAVRGLACGDCVIGVLLSTPTELVEGLRDPASGVSTGVSEEVDVPSGASTVQFDAVERRAIDLLAAQGLIPRLRLVADVPRRASVRSDSAETRRDVG